jgi:hypothetical protein
MRRVVGRATIQRGNRGLFYSPHIRLFATGFSGRPCLCLFLTTGKGRSIMHVFSSLEEATHGIKQENFRPFSKETLFALSARAATEYHKLNETYQAREKVQEDIINNRPGYFGLVKLLLLTQAAKLTGNPVLIVSMYAAVYGQYRTIKNFDKRIEALNRDFGDDAHFQPLVKFREAVNKHCPPGRNWKISEINNSSSPPIAAARGSGAHFCLVLG